MAFSLLGLAIAVHVLGPVLWAGATAFMAIVVFPALRKAGPGAEDDFVLAIARRGGFGAFFTPVAAVTLAAGAYVYWRGGRVLAPFADASATALTLAAPLGLAAFVYTLALMHPVERRMVAWLGQFPADKPLPPDARAPFREMTQRIGKRVAMGPPLLFLAILLMVGRALV